MKQHTYLNCCFTPNEPIRTYEEKLEELEDFLCEVTGDVIVAGDFNTKTVEWGSPHRTVGQNDIYSFKLKCRS